MLEILTQTTFIFLKNRQSLLTVMSISHYKINWKHKYTNFLPCSALQMPWQVKLPDVRTNLEPLIKCETLKLTHTQEQTEQ